MVFVSSFFQATSRHSLILSRMSAGDQSQSQISRRQALSSVAGAAFGVGVSCGSSRPAVAFGALDRVNRDLRNQGLPLVEKVPDGLSPLLEVYGKDQDNGRSRYLVQFFYPSLWVVQKPSITVNGEDGTIAAGDYQKGDSATFYVGEPLPSGKNLQELPLSFFEETVRKGISQKGDNIYQSLKVKKVIPGPTGYQGTQYYLVDFKYELVTGAGFTVERSALASVTAVGSNTQALICATTNKRYKKLEPVFRDIVNSFRVYDKVVVGRIDR